MKHAFCVAAVAVKRLRQEFTQQDTGEGGFDTCWSVWNNAQEVQRNITCVEAEVESKAMTRIHSNLAIGHTIHCVACSEHSLSQSLDVCEYTLSSKNDTGKDCHLQDL